MKNHLSSGVSHLGDFKNRISRVKHKEVNMKHRTAEYGEAKSTGIIVKSIGIEAFHIRNMTFHMA